MKLKRLTSLLVAGCMMVSMLPASAVTAFAAEGTDTSTVAKEAGVAEVNGTQYSTVAAAIEAASNGGTVTLLADINGEVVVPAEANITLDLNGKTIQTPDSSWDDGIMNYGTLTVEDSAKSGKIISKHGSGIGLGANSVTTIEDADITGQEGAIGGYKTTNGATVTINDGTFTGVDNAVVIFNGTNRVGDSNTVIINGGTFNGTIQSPGYVACGIYAPWNDNITVNNGTFNITDGAGIVARAGNVTVNRGEFHTTGNVTGKVGDSRVVVPCAALVFDSAANYPAMTDDSKIEVTGGTFESDVDAIHVEKKDSDTNQRIAVSGGTFSSDPTDYLVNKKVAVPDNGKYTVKAPTYDVNTDVDTDAEPDKAEQGEIGTPVEIEVTAAGKKEDVAQIKKLSLNFDNVYAVDSVIITKGQKTFDLAQYKDQKYQNMEIPGLFDDSASGIETDAEENAIVALLSDDTDGDNDSTINFTLNVTYNTNGKHSVTVVFEDEYSNPVSQDSTSVQIGAPEAGSGDGDSVSGGADAALILAGAAVGTGVAVFAYHIGTEIFADQILGKGVPVPSTREEVALKAWELAGKPVVAPAEGEQALSETEQAERWVVANGLMETESDGSFNGQKKVGKIKALRILDAAKEMNK